MSNSHSKGPWHLEFGHQQRDGGAIYWQVHDGADAIACNQFCWAGNVEANARLISAAPELLECLKDARRLLTDQDAIDLEYVDSVIAKAEFRAALSPDNSTQKKEGEI